MKLAIKQTDKLWMKRLMLAVFTAGVLLVPMMIYGQKAPEDAGDQASPDGRFLIVTIKDGPAAGMVPGQSMRFNLFNPAPAGTPAAGAQVKIFSASGSLLAQTGEVQIPAGAIHTFEIHRESLNVPGDPNTGRVQFRAEVELSVWQANTREVPTTVAFPSRYELVDRETGKAILVGMLLPAIQKVR